MSKKVTDSNILNIKMIYPRESNGNFDKIAASKDRNSIPNF